MSAEMPRASRPPYAAGTRVEIRNRFDSTWSNGFVIDEAVDGGYRVRRGSDDTVLPKVFPPEEVRRHRKGDSLWWV